MDAPNDNPPLELLMPFGNSQLDVPKGQLKIAQRFNAGLPVAPGQVPKGRLKGDGRCVQSSLRDSDGIDSVPGVETPGCSRDVPPGHRASNLRKASSLQPRLPYTDDLFFLCRRLSDARAKYVVAGGFAVIQNTDLPELPEIFCANC